MEVIIEEAEAKDFSNIEKLVRSVYFKVGDTVSVEQAGCFDLGGSDYGCGVEPTVANEFRVFQFRTESNIESPYNATLLYIDEQQAKWTLDFNASSPSDPRLFVNGSQLLDVSIDSTNVTEGGNFWTYLSGAQANRIDLHNAVATATNFTVFFPQNNNTQFATLGRSLEGNFLTTLTSKQVEKFINIGELFNPNSQKLSKMKQLFDEDREKIYTVLLKVVTDRFDVSATKIKQIASNYINHYKTEGNFDNFLDKLENFTRNKIPDVDT